ncbi:hypothetical protein PDE_01842 [Penicillium oxalicum 114-2]|uniref:Uncharacterized protein n=1 Tax=Penicillium oxalicum (strain 114-2 / CGMCC 5302) TaxID=933388 RepID=S8AY69_PENO1|nr:hypothetical protein PDE_01842 [Penicillium oxalicum 114-2]
MGPVMGGVNPVHQEAASRGHTADSGQGRHESSCKLHQRGTLSETISSSASSHLPGVSPRFCPRLHSSISTPRAVRRLIPVRARLSSARQEAVAIPLSAMGPATRERDRCSQSKDSDRMPAVEKRIPSANTTSQMDQVKVKVRTMGHGPWPCKSMRPSGGLIRNPARLRAARFAGFNPTSPEKIVLITNCVLVVLCSVVGHYGNNRALRGQDPELHAPWSLEKSVTVSPKVSGRRVSGPPLDQSERVSRTMELVCHVRGKCTNFTQRSNLDNSYSMKSDKEKNCSRCRPYPLSAISMEIDR